MSKNIKGEFGTALAAPGGVMVEDETITMESEDGAKFGSILSYFGLEGLWKFLEIDYLHGEQCHAASAIQAETEKMHCFACSQLDVGSKLPRSACIFNLG